MNTTSVIIQQNLVYLSEHLCNLPKVLIHFYAKGNIDQDGIDVVNSKIQTSEKNAELFRTIMKQEVQMPRLLRILRRTGNEHLVIKLEKYKPIEILPSCCLETLPELNTKWWPEVKKLPNAFCKRKSNDKYFVDELRKLLMEDRNQMTIINQTHKSSKLFGFGGIGKTATAKWYANHFENDYNHVIWIDCGEGSLLKSFRKLSQELKITDPDDNELEDLSLKIFEKLSDLKCLFIFDNAECYVGNDGIQTVLPKSELNFHCLITSRNHNWSLEDGAQISIFEIDVFDSAESEKFLAKTLNEQIETTNNENLTQLCYLLGNLPLAIELAISAMNNDKIALVEFIPQLSAEIESLKLDQGLDDYEIIVNATMKISLGNILKKPTGALANAILKIFSYIMPDEIDSLFFESTTNTESKALKQAIQLLTKYSFVVSNEDRSTLSIHRLLQQVIRFNGKTTENETLKAILSCEGFLDYKLMPYNFADDNLKKECGTLRAQLIDQFQLKNLLKARRFAEALALSSLIHSEMNSSVSLYNYAVCLVKNEESLELAEETLENLYSQLKMPFWGDEVRFEMGILNIAKEKPDKYIVAGKLFFLLCKVEKFGKAIKIFNEINELISCFAENHYLRVTNMIQLLNLVLLPSYNFTAEKNTFTLEISKHPKDGKKIKLEKCFLQEKTSFPSDLQYLFLDGTEFVDMQCQKLYSVDNTQLFLPFSVTKLEVTGKVENSIPSSHATELTISLTEISTIENIQLANCYIVLDGSRISPKDLYLEGIKFIRDGLLVTHVFVNEFVNFHQMNNLYLNSESMGKLIFDMSENYTMNAVKLKDITIFGWRSASWNIQKLFLRGMPFERKNNMKIKQLEFSNGSVDVNCLPTTIKKLCLKKDAKIVEPNKICHHLISVRNLEPDEQPSISSNSDANEEASAKGNHAGVGMNPTAFEFPNLTTLHLENGNISYLPYFQKCSSLEKLKLGLLEAFECEYDKQAVSQLSTIRELHLNWEMKNITISMTKALEKVVWLYHGDINKLNDIKSKFWRTISNSRENISLHQITLVILMTQKAVKEKNLMKFINQSEYKEDFIRPNIEEPQLIGFLTNQVFKRIIIGKFDWNKGTTLETAKYFEKTNFSLSVDTIGDYYVFEDGKGKAISVSEFEEHSSL